MPPEAYKRYRVTMITRELLSEVRLDPHCGVS